MSDLVLSIKLDGDSSGLQGEVRISRKELEKLNKTTEQSGKVADHAGQRMDRYGKELRETGRDAERLNRVHSNLARTVMSTVGLLAGGAGISSITRSFIEAAATSENFETRLKSLLGSAEEGSRLFDEMAHYAGRVPFEFEAIMASATQLAGVMKGGVDEINTWMPMIGDLAAVSGLGIQETTEQIVRMYSSGAASADRFRELGILSMLGFQAGVSYSAEETREKLLREWNKVGSKFKGATQDLADNWDGLMSMFSDRWFQFSNEVADAGMFDELKGEAQDLLNVLNEMAADGTLKEFAQNTSDALVTMGSHLDDAAIAITVLIAAKSAGAVASSRFVVALRAEYAAQMQATIANRSAAAFMGSAYTAAVARATMADRARAASLAAMTGAAGLARGALAMLGGPAGLIVLGATALTMWATSADEAAASTEDYALKLAQLEGNLKGVEQAQLKASLAQAEADRDRLLEAMKFKSGKEYSDLFRQYGEANRYINATNRKLLELSRQTEESAGSTGKLTGETSELSEANKKLIESLQEELDLIALSDRERAIQVELRKLDKDATDEQEASVRGLAAAIFDTNEAMKQQADAQKKLTQMKKADTDLITSMQQEYELMQMADRERAIEIDLRQLSAAATEEQKHKVKELSGAMYDYAEATKAAEDEEKALADEHKKAMQLIESSTQRAMGAAEDAFVKFVKTGKLEISDLIDVILDEFLRLQFKQEIAPSLGGLFNGIFGGGSLFGGFGGISSGGISGTASIHDAAAGGGGFGGFGSIVSTAFDWIGSLFHTGGIPGADGAQGSRYVHPAVWADAPRYHTGVGPGEEAAIIRRDEGVFTPGQMAAMTPVAPILAALGNIGAASQLPDIEIHFHGVPADTKPRVEHSRNQNGGLRMDVILDQVRNDVARDIATDGVVGRSIESTYGVSRGGRNFR